MSRVITRATVAFLAALPLGPPTPAAAEITCFTRQEIAKGRPGWHDTVPVDLDGDGDTDLVSKVWHTGGKPYHLDLWRNDNGTGCSAEEGNADGRTE